MPASLDRANITFWDELCGTAQAKVLGIADASAASLKKFDDWFFAFYPYLLEEVPVAKFADREVLEVGLGYGSLSQKIAESGARFVGLDIAAGPVEIVRHRLQQAKLAGYVVQGSILDPPFMERGFDYIVTIGCLHHTGDMKAAIDQCWRLLRDGGHLIMMVYNAYSYRRWMQARRQTTRYLLAEALGKRGALASLKAAEKWNYDHNTGGVVAPHIDFISAKSLGYYCRRFARFSYRRRNIDQERPFEKSSREELLKTRWPAICGLDLYATAVK